MKLKYKTFEEWKTFALKCRNKNIGKIITRYYRLHYDKIDNTVSLHIRGDKLISGTKDNLLVLTITNTNKIILHIDPIRIYAGEKSLLAKYFHIFIYKVPSKDLYKYGMDIPFIIKTNQNTCKQYVYIQNKTIFDLQGTLLYIDNYISLVIDKKFNREYSTLSKNIYRKLGILENIIGNNLSIQEVHTAFNRLNSPFDKSKSHLFFHKDDIALFNEIWKDLQSKQLTIESYEHWRFYAYYIIYIQHYSHKYPNIQFLIKPTVQKMLLYIKPDIARVTGHLNKTIVIQNV